MNSSSLDPTGQFKALVLLAGVSFGAATAATAGDQPVMLGFPVFVPNSVVVPVQEEGSRGDYGGGGAGISPASGAPVIANTPRAVGQALERATKFCESLPATEYTIDCLAYEYWEIQKQLPDYGEMSDVKKVLAETSMNLRKLAADNPSPSKRPARVSQGSRTFNRALVPVDRNKLPALKREAATIINNGATLLIRASGDSNRKRAQYQQIAKSMQTGAIMLRSL